jgi:hypothetical protein
MKCSNILVISTDPITKSIDDPYSVFGIHRIMMRSENASGFLKLGRQCLTISTQKINGGLEIDTLRLHDNCDNIGAAVALRLFHVVRKEILNEKSICITTREVVNTNICPKDEIHGSVIPADEDRVFVNMLREIKPDTIFHEVETSANSAGFATESNVAWDVQHLVFLAKQCLCPYDLDVGAEIFNETMGDVGTSSVDVVMFESENKCQ